MPRTLITGATGFIGSHLTRALAARGDELCLLVRSSEETAHLDDIEFERVNGDITDRRAVRRAVAGADRVFHAAGLTSMRREDGEQVIATNVGGTRIVCEEALDAGVQRLVHTSAAAALGPAPEGGRADESAALQRRRPRHPLRALQARGRSRRHCVSPRTGSTW